MSDFAASLPKALVEGDYGLCACRPAQDQLKCLRVAAITASFPQGHHARRDRAGTPLDPQSPETRLCWCGQCQDAAPEHLLIYHVRSCIEARHADLAASQGILT